MWLITLVILSGLFSLALSTRERERAMQAREDLVEAYNRDIADLNIENAILKGEQRL